VVNVQKGVVIMAKSFSPVIDVEPTEKEDKFNFPTAMERVIAGMKVCRGEWGDEEYYVLIKNDRLQLHKPDGEYYDWIISEIDLYAKDWKLTKDTVILGDDGSTRG
jgi:hypothetical protein